MSSDITPQELETSAKVAIEYTINIKKLLNCDYHEFCQDDKKHRIYNCSNCGGKVHELIKIWYEEGIKHAKNRECVKNNRD